MKSNHPFDILKELRDLLNVDTNEEAFEIVRKIIEWAERINHVGPKAHKDMLELRKEMENK